MVEPNPSSGTPIPGSPSRAVGPHQPDPYKEFDVTLVTNHHPNNVALYVRRINWPFDGIEVHPPIGKPLQYELVKFRQNTWEDIKDGSGNVLPLQIYIHGSLGVRARWRP